MSNMLDFTTVTKPLDKRNFQFWINDGTCPIVYLTLTKYERAVHFVQQPGPRHNLSGWSLPRQQDGSLP